MNILNGTSKQGNEFAVVRDAHIDSLTPIQHQGKKTSYSVDIKFAGFEHTFKPGHPIATAASVMDPKSLTNLLEGSTFMMVDGNMVEYRPGTYNGFVQSDEQIRVLMDLIGTSNAQDVNVSPRLLSRRIRDTDVTNPQMALATPWGSEEFAIPTFQEGGKFESRLIYNWSLFSTHVRASMQLVRLICTNGMIGWGEWFNNKIPLINRWEEHLNMASRQIQRSIETRATNRILEMGQQRASVAEMALIERHANLRLEAVVKGEIEADQKDREMLMTLSRLADASMFTSDVYQDNVFQDSSVAQLLPAHVSAFDAWNMVTELMTHTPECGESTNFALTRLANKMMFDEDHRKLSVLPSEQKLASFSDPRTAFFGALSH